MRLAAIFLWLSACAFGQTFNARITGTVNDATGAAVPAAGLTVRQLETGVTKKARTNAAGVYDVPLLLPGSYEVQVGAAGMDTMIRRDIKLQVNETVTVDFSLRVASMKTVLLQDVASRLAGPLIELRHVDAVGEGSGKSRRTAPG